MLDRTRTRTRATLRSIIVSAEAGAVERAATWTAVAPTFPFRQSPASSTVVAAAATAAAAAAAEVAVVVVAAFSAGGVFGAHGSGAGARGLGENLKRSGEGQRNQT